MRVVVSDENLATIEKVRKWKWENSKASCAIVRKRRANLYAASVIGFAPNLIVGHSLGER